MAARQPPAPVGAAAAAPGAHPQYSLPKYTPEELYVQKKQAEEIQKDVRHFVQMDTGAPFANLQDAVVRLLPFHLFNAADPATADLDDTPDHMGADLMASRHEAWEELCISKANDLRRRAEVHSSSITELEARMDRQALSGTRSTDHYAMAKLQQEDLKQKIGADKATLTKLLPAAAPMAAGAAGAGRAGQAGAAAGVLGIAGTQGLQPGAAAAAAKAAGRVPQQVLMPGALGMLQAQQLQAQQLIRHQQALASLTPQQQLAAVQMQQIMLQQQGLQPATIAALQQHQQQQQLLAQLLAAQQKKT